MSTVPLLLVAILLSVIFFIIHLILYNDFNENEFDNRLKVVTEYMKRTNADHPLPEKLSFVSSVDSHYYTVTTFDTISFNILNTTVHDDRFEVFDFLSQTATPTLSDQSDDVGRIRACANDERKFQIRGDDGWIDMECPFNKRFDERSKKCVAISYCENKPPGNYGLTEQMIDSLILYHAVVKSEEEHANELVHPTMYLRCFEGGSHATQECPSNHTFDNLSRECVMRNECESRPDNFILSIFPENLNINEYLMCKNEQISIVQCPQSQIFDRRLMRCVDAAPCSVHGAGYTYITNEISDKQFFECVSANEAALITCFVSRIYADGGYKCFGDAECVNLSENGTGTAVRFYEDDFVKYDTGALVCDNFQIVKNINCDTSNLIQDKVYNEKFTTPLNVPRQVYNSETEECVDFEKSFYTIKNKFFHIESTPNDLNVKFETSMIGKTDKFDTLLNSDRIDEAVIYAKDQRVVGLNPINGEPIECYGDTLYDVFDASRLNMCVDNELTETVPVNDGQYVKSKLSQVADDADYNSACALKIGQTANYVEMDHFSTSILTDILRNDVCGTILDQIHIKYTTLAHEYTTIDNKYTYESVKPHTYMDENVANISNFETTIFKTPFANAIGKTSVISKIASRDDKIVSPIFDPFEYIETVKPLFNPFDENINTNQIGDDEISDAITIDENDEIGDADDEQIDDEDVVEEDDDAPEQKPEELILSKKIVKFSCFYALPTFKYSLCDIQNDHIIESLAKLRENVTAHPSCVPAIGLSNVLNAYAYLGNGLGCFSFYTPESGIFVDRINDGQIYTNINTQSNDGVKYNSWIHVQNNKFLACPDDLFNSQNFSCNTDPNTLYYIENLQ
ncbi:vp91 capsid [Euproctis pseudoconspersa nucleopolyhedrovirus]|uniref:Vp91 capsid n=1 Tax=Euproctis pseudoconspersa nucleopolyhedrovirus TaxID=307467 RepID=C3TWY2_9ABAC|nr:vp91 capsid [Euproctis pseudoconspersa nucleopolyhedrovirus]ACO53524.1 vp91 capsid [Euproctis pseudoconspersa nucleopolyhedrovirus]